MQKTRSSLYLSNIIFHVVYYVNCCECGFSWRREPPAQECFFRPHRLQWLSATVNPPQPWLCLCRSEVLKGSPSEVQRAGFTYQNHIRDKKALVCIISYANVLFMFHWTSRGRERAFRWKEKKKWGRTWWIIYLECSGTNLNERWLCAKGHTDSSLRCHSSCWVFSYTEV